MRTPVALGEDLSLAKLTPPTTNGSLQRTRLLRELEGPITWVTGPPGSGKTTLIGDFARRDGGVCLWYRVDDRDRDLAAAFSMLTRAAFQVAPSFSDRAPAFESDETTAPARFARRYFEALFAYLERPALLVLDDAHHVVGARAWEGLLRECCRALPPGVRLIVASRAPLPKALARPRVHGELRVVDGDTLRFDKSEVSALLEARHGEVAARRWARRVFELTTGWSAGVALMCANLGRNGAPARTLDTATLAGYLDAEVLDPLPEHRQRFLFETAVVASLDESLADELTSNGCRGTELERIHRQHLFIRRLDGSPPRYRYHELFRRHLLARGRRRLGEKQWRALVSRAVASLSRRDQLEEAIDLALDEGLFEQAEALVVQNGERLEQSGRLSHLLAWIERIPSDLVEESGWLLFWRGVAHHWLGSFQALRDLYAAYRLHKAHRDERGMLASWSEMVAAAGTFSAHLATLERALAELDELPPAGSWPRLDLRVAASTLTLLQYQRPDDPRIDAIADRATEMALASKAGVQRARAGLSLSLHAILRADTARGALALRRDVGDRGQLPPVVRIHLAGREIALEWLRGNGDAVEAAEDAASQLVDETRLEPLRPAYLLMGAAHLLSRGDIDAADDRLRRIWAGADSLSAMTFSVALVFRTWLALARGKPTDAEQILSSWAEANKSVELPGGETLIGVARGFCAWRSGRFDEARDWFERSLAQATHQSSYLHIMSSLAGLTLLSLDVGERDGAISTGRRLCALARQRGVFGFFFVGPHEAARIAALALEEDFGVTYAKALIQKYRLSPPEPVSGLLGWPVRLRLRTLGTVRIERDGEAVELGARAPFRQLELLAAIVAGGGVDVPIASVLDKVWPRSEGDAAHRALKPTLHRLRSLLVVRDVLTLRNGCLTLDPLRCWNDVAALRAIHRAVAAGPGAYRAKRLARALTNLVGGPFAASLGNPPWALSIRRELEALARRTAARLLDLVGDRAAASELRRLVR